MGKQIQLEVVYRPPARIATKAVEVERVLVAPAKMAPLPSDVKVIEVVAKDVTPKKPKKLKPAVPFNAFTGAREDADIQLETFSTVTAALRPASSLIRQMTEADLGIGVELKPTRREYLKLKARERRARERAGRKGNTP